MTRDHHDNMKMAVAGYLRALSVPSTHVTMQEFRGRLRTRTIYPGSGPGTIEFCGQYNRCDAHQRDGAFGPRRKKRLTGWGPLRMLRAILLPVSSDKLSIRC
jgi:hypothetical protein